MEVKQFSYFTFYTSTTSLAYSANQENIRTTINVANVLTIEENDPETKLSTPQEQIAVHVLKRGEIH